MSGWGGGDAASAAARSSETHTPLSSEVGSPARPHQRRHSLVVALRGSQWCGACSGAVRVITTDSSHEHAHPLCSYGVRSTATRTRAPYTRYYYGALLVVVLMRKFNRLGSCPLQSPPPPPLACFAAAAHKLRRRRPTFTLSSRQALSKASQLLGTRYVDTHQPNRFGSRRPLSEQLSHPQNTPIPPSIDESPTTAATN